MQTDRLIGLSGLLPYLFLVAVVAAGQAPAPQAKLSSVASASDARISVTGAAPVLNSAGSLISVNRVQVLGGGPAVEIEIEGSGRLAPEAQVLSGPDRLVVDFANAAPGEHLRNVAVNRGNVKDVRVGLFQASPPVTRVVFDLNAPQSYQIFPSGKSVIVKVSGGTETVSASTPKPNLIALNPAVAMKEAAVTPGAVKPALSLDTAAKNSAPKFPDEGIDEFPPLAAPSPALTTASLAGGANIRAAAAEPTLDVTFRNGMLSIKANKASLGELLSAVHQRTGAEIELCAGAEQERVAAEIGPGPAPEVLAQLLNGSKFNFLIVSSPDNSRVLDRVILTPKAEGAVQPLPPMQTDLDQDIEKIPPEPLPQVPEGAAVENSNENPGPPGSGPPPGVPPFQGQRLTPRQPPAQAGEETPPPDN